MIKTIETSSTWNGGEITKDMYTQIQQAMITSAEGIAQKAKRLVREGEGKPQHLRDTIRAVGRRKKPRLEILAHGVASGDYETALPGAWVIAGARRLGVYWAHYVEFGTFESPAHAFMRPAADSSFNAVLAEAAHAGQRVINRRRRRRAARRRRAG